MSKFSFTDFFHRVGAFPRFSVCRSERHNSHEPERNFQVNNIVHADHVVLLECWIGRS